MTSMEKVQIRKLQERKAELIDEFIGRCEEINYQIKAIRNGKWKIVPVEDEEEE